MANQAGAYPSFLSVKRLGVFLLPPDGILVYRRVTSALNSPVPIYTPESVLRNVEHLLLSTASICPWANFCPQSSHETIRMEHFHVTSRQPYWCTKPVLWELNFIFMQNSSFVWVNQYDGLSREWKRSKKYQFFFLCRFIFLQIIISMIFPRLFVLTQRQMAISYFTVVYLDTKPLSRSEAHVDLVLIQTLLLLICKSFSCYAN